MKLRYAPLLAALVPLLPTPAAAQAVPAASATFGEKVLYLVTQAQGGFPDLRGDSLGPGMWQGSFPLGLGLDSLTARTASSITELARQHADGRPGRTVVGVFPLELVAPTDSSTYVRYRALLQGLLPGWQSQAPAGGHWSECPDPRRGREVLLSSGKTASGQLLLLLTITMHPDAVCG